MMRRISRALALVGVLWGSGLNAQTRSAEQTKPPGPPAPATRLETEYKLGVPAGQDDAVWHWLNTQYGQTKPRALGKAWTSSRGEETFRDEYFDVPAGTLLRARAGLRHRQRFDTTGRLTKQLVQLKITDDASGVLRKELKYKPVEGAAAAQPIADLLRPADRPRLDSALATLGVRLAGVQPVFTLGQRRRRLYFQKDDEAFSTITLDSSYNVGDRRATFTEVEIELNEKRYTAAAEPERARMRQILDTLRADLLRQFPALKQDQRPKYQKLAELLADGVATPPPYTAAATTATPPETVRVPWLLAVFGALGGLTIGYLIVRRRRAARA